MQKIGYMYKDSCKESCARLDYYYAHPFPSHIIAHNSTGARRGVSVRQVGGCYVCNKANPDSGVAVGHRRIVI
jgi:hypothetical protein